MLHRCGCVSASGANSGVEVLKEEKPKKDVTHLVAYGTLRSVRSKCCFFFFTDILDPNIIYNFICRELFQICVGSSRIF